MAPEIVQGAERREESVLYGVGAILFVAKVPAGHGHHGAAVLPDELRTGILVTGPDLGEELGFCLLFAGLPAMRQAGTGQ